MMEMKYKKIDEIKGVETFGLRKVITQYQDIGYDVQATFEDWKSYEDGEFPQYTVTVWKRVAGEDEN